MINIQVEAPDTWSPIIDAATSTWPRAVKLSRGPLASGPAAAVAARVVPVAPPASSHPPPPPGRSWAVVVGSRPMAASRFTSWAHRTLVGTVGAGDASIAGWESSERAHRFDLPVDARASHEARKAVRSLAQGLARIDDILLATSELAANAFQHGGGVRGFTAYTTESAFVVALADGRPDRSPSVLNLRGAAASGRGMAIIDAISDFWGVTALADTKVVWCEFALHPDAAPSPAR